MAALPAQQASGTVDASSLATRQSLWVRHKELFLGAIGVLGTLTLWQVAAGLGIANPRYSSSPFGAAQAFVEMFATGEIWAPIGSTLMSIGWGIGISITAGIPIGLVIGRSEVLHGLTDPLISVMYSVPYVIFLPIIIFWFGIGDSARVVLVIWSSLFPLLINVIAGTRNVSRSYLQVAQVFTASRLRTLWSVAFPATLPYILAGVRLAVGRGLVGAIVAELFMGTVGLGYVVQNETSNFQMDSAMAAIAIIAVLAIALTRGVGYLERRYTAWSRSA